MLVRRLVVLALAAAGCARSALLDPPIQVDAASADVPVPADARDLAPPREDAPQDLPALDLPREAATDGTRDGAGEAREAGADARDAAPEAGCRATFGLATAYKIGPWARAIAVADLDGDDRPEVVFNDLPQPGAGMISTIRNAGGRTFGAEVSVPAHPTEIQGLAAADFDGDARLDIAAVEHQSSTVRVYINDGGKVSARGDTPAGAGKDGVAGNASDLAAADLNGDGRPDLVTGLQDLFEGGAASIGVLINRGDAAFWPIVTYPVSIVAGQMGGTYVRGPTKVAIGDVNGDGWNDIAAATTDSHVSVYLNRKDGTFLPQVQYPIGGQGPSGNLGERVAIGDLDGDGRPDLAVSNAWGPSVGFLVNTGNGVFAPEKPVVSEMSLGSQYQYLTIADIDGDGRNDLVTASFYGNSPGVSVFLNQGAATFAPPVTYSADPNSFIEGLTVADIDRDGRLDVVLITDGTPRVLVFYGTCAPR